MDKKLFIADGAIVCYNPVTLGYYKLDTIYLRTMKYSFIEIKTPDKKDLYPYFDDMYRYVLDKIEENGYVLLTDCNDTGILYDILWIDTTMPSMSRKIPYKRSVY